MRKNCAGFGGILGAREIDDGASGGGNGIQIEALRAAMVGLEHRPLSIGRSGNSPLHVVGLCQLCWESPARGDIPEIESPGEIGRDDESLGVSSPRGIKTAASVEQVGDR